MKTDCEACNISVNRKPTPATSIPKVTKHNQMVTVDLKEWGEGKYRYIAYAVDRFSRLTVGEFIPDKEAETIGKFLLTKWISIFGRMKILHSDCGGEFIKKELTALAQYLDIKQTNTAASSPQMNGVCERNHAVVDRILEKMLFTDPTMPPEVALMWALNAKNTLENHQGFSPAQLVFGENPSLPSIYASGPAGWEEMDVDLPESFAEHITALHSAREAFIQTEADKSLKTILKNKIYSGSEEIMPNDWVYLKKQAQVGGSR